MWADTTDTDRQTHRQTRAHQHGSLGDVTGLCLLLRHRLHVIPVCCHGGVGRRWVDGDHLDTLVLEELQHHTQHSHSKCLVYHAHFWN